jgi:large subunit ribosomal protein L25
MAKHETPTISAQPRDRIGSRYAKRLRQQGRLPAVIYGHQQDPVSIHVDEKETVSLLEHGAHIVNVKVANGPSETCLVKELQFGYLGDNVIHVDLARVSLDEEVEVSVHLRFTGEPAAAKKPGAVLTHSITELEVICKASDIPDEIVVPIGAMEDVFTVGQIVLPAGIRTKMNPDTPVSTITFIAEEIVAEAVEVVGEAEPEVITERKPEAEGEGEATEEKA